MAEKLLESLLTGQSVFTLVFGFLLTYFIWDVITRIRKVDRVEADIGGILASIQAEIKGVKALVEGQGNNLASAISEISELKAQNRSLSHRLVKVETILQIKEMHKNGELEGLF